MKNYELAKKLETARLEIVNMINGIGLDARLLENQLQEIMAVEGELFGPEDWSKFSAEFTG